MGADANQVPSNLRFTRSSNKDDFPTAIVREINKWGLVDVIFERTPAQLAQVDGKPYYKGLSAGLYRLMISPQCAIPEHIHLQMNESELVFVLFVCACVDI